MLEYKSTDHPGVYSKVVDMPELSFSPPRVPGESFVGRAAAASYIEVEARLEWDPAEPPDLDRTLLGQVGYQDIGGP
jgi:hypothetical protein